MDDLNHKMMQERAKELRCLYAVDEVLLDQKLTVPETMEEIIRIIPSGFSWSGACRVKITLNKNEYCPPDYNRIELTGQVPILMGEEPIGTIEVGYIPDLVLDKDASLLPEELQMLNSIANRISQLLLNAQRDLSILFDMLQRIDPDMLERICEKLQVYLQDKIGGRMDFLLGNTDQEEEFSYGETNTPMVRRAVGDAYELSKRLIADAFSHLSSAHVYELISGWIQDERAFSLVRAVDCKDASIPAILEAATQYTKATSGRKDRNRLIDQWLVVELAHRFLTNDEYLLDLVLDNLRIKDFIPMMGKIICSPTSMGNIGGKAAGLYIGKQILNHAAKEDPLLEGIQSPKSWYIATDGIVDFLHHNHMEDYNAYKYNTIEYLRMTYDTVVAKIKNAKLPPYTMQMFYILLDDFGDVPLIVRSSSLLEDRQGSIFSGKYKSLFLTNQGPKAKRVEELADAVLEVYSSMYSPDSIQYRKERGMLNFTEQMGVLIQEVIGCYAGPYFMPVFAGVAFSNNLLRWSTRVTREEGLVRMVPGLGTRAVDRVNDDYPLLFSPGRPGLRINQTASDSMHYSPKYIDLLNLEKECFETLPVDTFLQEYGKEIPGLHKIVSVYQDDFMHTKGPFDLNPAKDKMFVTFEGILANTDIPAKIKRMLDVLSQKMETPVDIEFAYNGETLYLLQCRPQGQGLFSEPAPIPQNILPQDIVFTANRFIINGWLEGITHLVYVDRNAYNSLENKEDMLAVGRAIGLLNSLLPRRKFVLMGPGRWGSRGDIQLGVRVTYSDISNTAALIEVAREQQSYVPELSFGTHFFQDLVEAEIVYIPLYPDDKEVVFQEEFFGEEGNILAALLPEYAKLASVIRVVNLPERYNGRTMSIRLNGDTEECMAFLQSDATIQPIQQAEPARKTQEEEEWRWRRFMVQSMADELDMEALGIKGVYLYGSTQSKTAQIDSEIELLFHVNGNKSQKKQLEQLIDTWSTALGKFNFIRTGCDKEKLLDAQVVTDKDIEENTPYGLKITSPAHPALLLRKR